MECYWQFSDEYELSNLNHLKSKFSKVFKPRESDMSLISAMCSKKQGRDSLEKFFNDLVDINFSLKKQFPDMQIIESFKSNMDTDIVRKMIFTYETCERINFFHKVNQAYHDVCETLEKRKHFYDYKTQWKVNEIYFDQMSINEIEEITGKFNNWETKRTLKCFNCKLQIF